MGRRPRAPAARARLHRVLQRRRSAAGRRLDSSLRGALRRSKTLFLDPRRVRKEVEAFRERHPTRPIVTVSVGGALQDAGIGLQRENGSALTTRSGSLRATKRWNAALPPKLLSIGWPRRRRGSNETPVGAGWSWPPPTAAQQQTSIKRATTVGDGDGFEPQCASPAPTLARAHPSAPGIEEHSPPVELTSARIDSV